MNVKKADLDIYWADRERTQTEDIKTRESGKWHDHITMHTIPWPPMYSARIFVAFIGQNLYI